MNGDILIIDDEKDICELVAGILNDEGYTTRTAQNTDSALNECSARFPQCIILDIWLKESQMDGLQLCTALKKQNPQTPIIMMSGHGTIELAVEAMKLGAYNFLTKPFRADHLLLLVEKSLQDAKITNQYNQYVAREAKNSDFYIGDSPAIKELNKKIDKLTQSNARVLVRGGYGSNQYFIAQTLAQQSGKGVIVTCDCADETQLAQLFNPLHHAVSTMEQCHNGILILNEIQFLQRDIQEKLSQFMANGKFTRTSDNAQIAIDTRIIATISLHDGEEPQKYTDDNFLTRIASAVIDAPPLHERLEDLPHLCQFYLQRISDILSIRTPQIAPECFDFLKSSDWQKNYWQLYNTLERIVIHNPHKNIITQMDIENLNQMDDNLPAWATQKNFKDAMGEFERRYILYSLNQFHGHVSKTAEYLGMDRATLHRKMSK